MAIIVDDNVSAIEKVFPFPPLLALDYFRKYRKAYYRFQEEGLQIQPRNYINLLFYLMDITSYKHEHGQAFAKRFRTDHTNWRNCEAVFAEMIVYRSYIPLVYEGTIKSIDLEHQEADIIIEQCDGSKAYYEVFCIMPDFVPNAQGVVDVQTHTQQALSSVRQKLLRKIAKQRQLSTPRENFVVIELNDMAIAGNFTVLSSLSSGYKIWLDKNTMQAVGQGYDWTHSVFDDDSTRYLKCIIFFDLGDYASRRFLYNPLFTRAYLTPGCVRDEA